MALQTLTTGWCNVADTTYPNVVQYKIDVVEESYDIANNTSYVSAVNVYMKTTKSSIAPQFRWYWSINLGGNTMDNGTPHGVKLTTSGVLVWSFTDGWTFTHTTDGSLSITLNRSMSSYDNSANLRYNVPSTSSTIKLYTIPRASTPSVSGSVTMGNTITITTNRAASIFTHTLSYAFGETSGTIASDVGASTTWTIPMSLANQIPSATSGTLSITCVTYNGSTNIGTKTITLTLSVPASVVPTVGASCSDYVTAVFNKFGTMVQGHSRLSIIVTGAGVYGSTISKMVISVNGETITDTSFTSGEAHVSSILKSAGSQTGTVTLTDTRGRTASTTITFDVAAYSPPAISVFSLDRCDKNGTIDSEGECLLMDLSTSVTQLNGFNKPTSIKITYVQSDTSNAATTIYSTSLTSTFALNLTDTILGTYTGDHGPILADYAYVVVLTVSDQLEASTFTRLVERAAPILDILADGTGIGIGTVAQHSHVAEFGMQVVRSGGLVNLWSNIEGVASGTQMTGVSNLFRYFSLFSVHHMSAAGVPDGAPVLAVRYTDADGNPYIEGIGGSVGTGGSIISYAFSAIYDEAGDKLTSMQMYSSTGAARKVTAIYGVA